MLCYMLFHLRAQRHLSIGGTGFGGRYKGLRAGGCAVWSAGFRVEGCARILVRLAISVLLLFGRTRITISLGAGLLNRAS
jgi:hypothetical protein